MADNNWIDHFVVDDNDGVGGGGDDDIFVYAGGHQEVPFGVKRVRIAENVDTIPWYTFSLCQQLSEVEGHDKLRKVGLHAFKGRSSLRRVTKMTGIIEIEADAFYNCHALSEFDFEKLEIIGNRAFGCSSLRSINLPSIRRICYGAFMLSYALTDVVFGQDLERIEAFAFNYCTALRRIVIPLKYGLIVEDEAFNKCVNLSRVDALAGGIHTTISSLHLESWRDEMQDEIDVINQALPNTQASEKSGAIQQWITSVLGRVEHFKSEHKMLVKEAMTLLELALWKANLHDADDAAAAQEGVRVTRGQRKRARKDRCITSGASIVIKNVLPFLALQ
jgi:hypothetical protein